jgi:hypothetical protein
MLVVTAWRHVQLQCAWCRLKFTGWGGCGIVACFCPRVPGVAGCCDYYHSTSAIISAASRTVIALVIPGASCAQGCALFNDCVQAMTEALLCNALCIAYCERGTVHSTTLVTDAVALFMHVVYTTTCGRQLVNVPCAC